MSIDQRTIDQRVDTLKRKIKEMELQIERLQKELQSARLNVVKVDLQDWKYN